MRLIRGEDGNLIQTGIADHQPISLKRQSTMKGVATRRKRMTTAAEKKLCFAFQAMAWHLGGVVRYQRERTVHIADMLSRSLDFYFSAAKLGVEADGRSHDGEIQAAKDAWTDELILTNDGIRILRFSNEIIMESVHVVVAQVATQLRNRHRWPYSIHERFNFLVKRAETAESWREATTEFIIQRKQR